MQPSGPSKEAKGCFNFQKETFKGKYVRLISGKWWMVPRVCISKNSNDENCVKYPLLTPPGDWIPSLPFHEGGVLKQFKEFPGSLGVKDLALSLSAQVIAAVWFWSLAQDLPLAADMSHWKKKKKRKRKQFEHAISILKFTFYLLPILLVSQK